MEEEIIYDHEYSLMVPTMTIEEDTSSSWPASGPKNGQVMKCLECGDSFQGRNEFVNHQRTKHPEKRRGTVRCPLENCIYSCYRINQLVEHLKKFHDHPVVCNSYKYNNEEEFMQWKEDYELKNNCQFRLSSSKYHGNWRYYNCSRTGFYNPKSVVKRRSKLKGTSKMNGHCISGMVVKIAEDGTVDNTFTETHCGHDFDTGYLRLCPSQRSYIEQLLQAGMAVDAVVVKMNKLDSMLPKTEISKKDVLNVVYTLTNKKLDCSFNFSSPLSLWESDEELIPLKDNIIFHKAKGEEIEDMPDLNTDDFVMCIMTPRQSYCIHKYVEKGLCIEVNRGSNESTTLSLITIMSYEKSKKSNAGKCDDVPLAWCISNVDDIRIKRCFFSIVAEKCGDLCTPFLMTNEWRDSYRAWSHVFNEPGMHIVSPWAVRSLLEASIKRFVIGTERQRTIMEELEPLFSFDTIQFSESISHVSNNLFTQIEYREFGQYFIDHFLNGSAGNWAPFYYIPHTKDVNSFMSMTSNLLPKLRSYAHKRVGRCAHMIMRHYVSKLHHLDGSFVRKRKRVKQDEAHIIAPVVDTLEMKRQTLRALLINVRNLNVAGVRPASYNAVIDQLQIVKDITDTHPLRESDAIARHHALQKKRAEQTAQAVKERKKLREKQKENRLKKVATNNLASTSLILNPASTSSVAARSIGLPSIPRIKASKTPTRRAGQGVSMPGTLPPRSMHGSNTITSSLAVQLLDNEADPDECILSVDVLDCEDLKDEDVCKQSASGGVTSYTEEEESPCVVYISEEDFHKWKAE